MDRIGDPGAGRGSVLERAYVKIREQKALIERLRAGADDAIAVIGFACRLPGGANDGPSFWRVLNSDGDSFSQIGDERWRVDAHHDPKGREKGKSYTLAAGLVGDVDRFDAAFFNVPALEAESLDPQQRMLLESSWHALEDAGLDPQRLRGSSTGVFIGLTNDDYAQLQARSGLPVGTYTGLGTAKSMSAGRVCYFYDFHGPALQLDTSCSSVLVAAHLAARELREGNCDLALVGGANAIVSPDTMAGFCEMQALSRSGKLRAFDDSADGYVRGEGCGTLVLKRLADARRDGDRVHGVLLGSAVNHDGRTNGLTAPNPAAQEQVMRRALASARIGADEVQYVEAHGTGTRIGDVLEAKALATVYGGREGSLRIGSVKANVGHLEAAAGMPSVIKVLLSLKHDRVPGQVNFDRHNARIDWKSSGLEVSAEDWPWPRGGKRRVAGISALGMSGTNVHCIVAESAPQDLPDPVAALPLEPLLLVSARTERELRNLLLAYAERVAGEGSASPIAQVAASQCRRRHFPVYRQAVPLQDAASTATELKRRAALPSKAPIEGGQDGVVFVFNGQGTQHPGMAAGLYRDAPAFRAAMDECAEVFRTETGADLIELCCEPSAFSRTSLTENTQPAIVAMGIALNAFWRSLGLEPAAVLGHSIGEFAAAVAAGSLTPQQAMRLVCLRARAVAEHAPPGAMFAVVGEPAMIAVFASSLPDGICVAAANSPRQVTVACGEERVEACLAHARANSLRALRIPASHAFHSPDMSAAAEAVRAAFLSVRMRAPGVTWVGTTGREARERPWSDPAYLVSQLTEPVAFQAGVERLVARGFHRFLEVGPDEVLLSAIRAIAPDQPLALASTLRKGADPWKRLSVAASQLYEMGADLDWTRLWRGPVKAVDLPLYPFHARRHWLNLPAMVASPASRSASPAPGAKLGFDILLREGVDGKRTAEIPIGATRQPHLSQHRLFDTTVMAAASWIALLLQLGQVLFEGKSFGLRSLRFLRPFVIGDEEVRTLCIELQPDAAGFRFVARAGQGETAAIHVEGGLVASGASEGVVSASPGRGDDVLHALDGFYEKFEARGYELGPAFQWLVEGRRGIEGASRRMRRPELPADGDSYPVFPGLVDSVLHALAGCLDPDSTLADAAGILVPSEISSVDFSGMGAADREYLVEAQASPWDARTSTSLQGRLAMRSKDGTHVLSMEGVALRYLSQATLRQALRSEEALTALLLEWRPVPAEALVKFEVPGTIAIGAGAASWLLGQGIDPGSLLIVDERAEAGDPVRLREDFRARLQRSFGAAGELDLVVVMAPSRTQEASPCGEEGIALACMRLAALLGGIAHWAGERRQRLRFVLPGALSADLLTFDLHNSALAGFLASATLEYPSLSAQVLDCDTASPQAESALWSALRAGAPEASGEFVLRGQQWFTKSFAPVVSARATAPALRGGVALITGGSGALAPVLCKWLLDCGAAEVRLLSRNAPSAGPDAALGARTSWRCCDVREGVDVERVFGEIASEGKHVSAIVHAAGILTDGMAASLALPTLRDVLAPKVEGALQLSRCWDSETLQLVLAISSAASVEGNAGQAAYSAANRVLDRWTESLRREGIPAATLNLGPVDAGMGSRLRASDQARLQRLGLRPMPVGLVASAATIAAGSADGQALVFLAAEARPALPLRGYAGPAKTLPDLDTLLASLQRATAELIDAERGLPSADASLVQLGADSLFATEFSSWIRAEYGVVLPMESILTASTLRALAQRVHSEVSVSPKASEAHAEAGGENLQWVEGTL
jgi:acyl transferase domain-containing protein/short-subunit dehydrogenase/acyl carrier protein